MATTCQRCPRVLRGSCCEVEPQERLATLTLADVDRFAGAAARRVGGGVEEEWWSLAEAQEYEARRPLYRGYFRHGPRRLTLAREGGACVFLDRTSGCRLGPEERPTACRLYPFELWPDGSWSLQVGRHGELGLARSSGDACLAVEEAEDMDQVLLALGTSRSEVEELGARLRREVADHARRTAPAFLQAGPRRRGRRTRRPV